MYYGLMVLWLTENTQSSSNTDTTNKYPSVEGCLLVGVVAARDHVKQHKWIPLYSNIMWSGLVS